MNIKDYNFKGQRAFVRVDFNVPLENGKITDDTRIRGAMPTLKKIIGDGGRLIIASHLGRPEKNPDPKYSLRQIVDTVSEYLGVKIAFAPDCGKARSQVDALGDGEALMLENLRFYAEEEGKPRNIETLDENARDLPILRENREQALNAVMSNSFGFGGTNATLIFSRVRD